MAQINCTETAGQAHKVAWSLELTCLWTAWEKVHFDRDSSSSVATCRFRTKHQEVFAVHGGRNTWGTSITSVAVVWCAGMGRELRRGRYPGESCEQASLWAGRKEESIDTISSSLVTMKCIEQGRVSGLMRLWFTSAVLQTNQEPGNPLRSMKNCFLVTACFLMQQGKEGWGRGS